MKAHTVIQYVTSISSYVRPYVDRRELLQPAQKAYKSLSSNVSTISSSVLDPRFEQQFNPKEDNEATEYLLSIVKDKYPNDEFTQTDLSRILQVTSWRMYDPRTIELSQSSRAYKEQVFASYQSLFQNAMNDLFQLTRESLTSYIFSSNSLLKDKAKSGLSLLNGVDRYQLIKSSPGGLTLSASKSSLKTTQSLCELSALTHLQKSSGAVRSIAGREFPVYKHIMEIMLAEGRQPHQILAEIDATIIRRVLELDAQDPARNEYFKLKQSLKDSARVLMNMPTKAPSYIKKLNSNELLRLSNLDCFIQTINPGNKNPLSLISQREWVLLMTYSKELNLSSVKLLSFMTLSNLDYKDIVFTKSDILQLKLCISQNAKKIRNKAHRDIILPMSNKLVSSRSSYLTTRLDKSIKDRLSNKFLSEVETAFQGIYTAHVGFVCPNIGLLQFSGDFLFSGLSLADQFRDTLARSSRLSRDVLKKLYSDCKQNEYNLRAQYLESYRVEYSKIPARLSFESKYAESLITYRNDIVARRSNIYSKRENRSLVSQQRMFDTHLPVDAFGAYSLSAESFFELTVDDLRGLIRIMRMRESDSRSSDFHFTKYHDDPCNLPYIMFGRAITKSMNYLVPASPTRQPIDLIQVLFNVSNLRCLNLDYAMEKLGFTYPDNLVKTSMVEFNLFSDGSSNPRYASPELYGMYLCGDVYYTVLGLYLVNNARLHKAKNDQGSYVILSIPDMSEFQLLKTLDEDGQFRALLPEELGLFWEQEYHVSETGASSFPLWVKGKNSVVFYNSTRYLLAQLVVPSWHDKGVIDHTVVFKLIEAYLDTDPLVKNDNGLAWRRALLKWRENLIYFESGKPRPLGQIYCLYGQVLDGEMYMFHFLYRLLKEDAPVDDLMAKLTVWYLNRCEGETEQHQLRRLDILHNKYVEVFEKNNKAHQLYFNLSQTRFEKLAEKLSQKGRILENYYQFMIPTLDVDVDSLHRSSIMTIPFAHAILSENGKELYDLREVEAVFQKTGEFNNIYYRRSFSELERKRIRANLIYRKYNSEIETKEEARIKCQTQSERLSTRTVRAIFDFLNETYALDKEIIFELAQHERVTYEGVTVCLNYTPDKRDKLILDILYKRIDRFVFDFYSRLPESERQVLDNYYIYSSARGKRVRFSEILNRFIDPKSGDFCLDMVTEPLFLAVLDYGKSRRFREWLEIMSENGRNWLDSLREQAFDLDCSDVYVAYLQQLKLILFRLTIADSHPALCREIKQLLKTKHIDKTIENLSIFYLRIKKTLMDELVAVSKQLREAKQKTFSVSPALQKNFELLSKLKTILQSNFRDDEDVTYYEPSYIASALYKCLNSWSEQDIPVGLRTAYASISEKSASRVAYLYDILEDKTAVSETYITAFLRRGVDIRDSRTIKEDPNHFLEVEINIIWENYLKTLNDEPTRERLRNYLSRMATSSNSFDGCGLRFG